jgi:DNA modification methylase
VQGLPFQEKVLGMITFIQGDCRTELAKLADASVNCCVTSPPYFGLRDYGVADQIGLEATPVAFVAELVAVFREVRRVLRDDGTCWLNLGDSYASAWPAPNTRRNIIDQPMSDGKRGPQRQSKLHGSLKEKDLMGIPWRVAFALQDDGWYLRQDIIWAKPNPMPESVQDRCTKAHEYVFLLSKSPRYWYDADAIAEPVTASTVARLAQDVDSQQGSDRIPGKTNGTMKAVGPRVTDDRKELRSDIESRHRSSIPGGQSLQAEPNGKRNARSVWNIATQPFSEAHFATFPPELAERCIKAGCPEGGTVLDPFGGAGTTGLVADRLQRNAVLIELNPAYAAMAKRRIENDAGLFAEVRT